MTMGTTDNTQLGPYDSNLAHNGQDFATSLLDSSSSGLERKQQTLCAPFMSIEQSFYTTPPAVTRKRPQRPLRHLQKMRGLECAKQPLQLAVPGIGAETSVKIASQRDEWEAAFELVADRYQQRGYESLDSKMRFTPYHALPETVTFVAKQRGHVAVTMSLVPDNALLGLPMETIYADEVMMLRRQRRRIGEVTCFAAAEGLATREFHAMFMALIRLMKQFHRAFRGDTWVITVNPRHSSFYTKKLGYVPIGPRRLYETVGHAPAQAYMVDMPLLEQNAPHAYESIFGKPVPSEALTAPSMPDDLVRDLSARANETARRTVQDRFELQ